MTSAKPVKLGIINRRAEDAAVARVSMMFPPSKKTSSSSSNARKRRALKTLQRQSIACLLRNECNTITWQCGKKIQISQHNLRMSVLKSHVVKDAIEKCEGFNNLRASSSKNASVRIKDWRCGLSLRESLVLGTLLISNKM